MASAGFRPFGQVREPELVRVGSVPIVPTPLFDASRLLDTRNERTVEDSMASVETHRVLELLLSVSGVGVLVKANIIRSSRKLEIET